MTPLPAAVLQALIQIDTSNPPGGETRAAEYLRTILEPAGVECTLVARDPRRANLVARIPGSGDGPRLAFLCHLDVVPTDTREWSVDPYGGMIRDGQVWGRGAVDMKSQLAAVTVALATLAADGFRPGGDVMLLAVADEEVGDEKVGMPWLVEERADLAPDFVVGEGSGERLPTSAGPIYMLDHGVKGSSSATLSVQGSSGDASLPRSGDNALARLGELLARLDRRPPPLHLLPELEPLLAKLAPGDAPLAERAARARAQHPALDRLIEALLSNVITATQAHANGPANAVSADAKAHLYIAALPGATAAELERELRAALGDGDYQLDVDEPEGGSTSPLNTPLHGAIESFLAEHDPEAQLVPALGYGFSDCHFARQVWGSVAYGFIPFRHADPLVNLLTKHGADERVPIADLHFQVDAAVHVARHLANG
ncbi:MAG: M20/M25/M40 family metallo-hydrolase [Gaiellaceae bacterium]